MIITGKKEIRACGKDFQLVIDNGITMEHGGFFSCVEAAEAAWERHLAGAKQLSEKNGGEPVFETWTDVPESMKGPL